MPTAQPNLSKPAAPAAKPLHIFKPGKHQAMGGAVIEFAQSDLDATASAYDPALSEAPLVVGHPTLNAPAYGWVQGLAANQNGVFATPRQVNPEFAELVNQGAFKRISASFYAPDSPQNPVPGVYYLRHVGFLGAAAPAVKGLQEASFSAQDIGVVSFSSEWDDVTNSGLWRNLREWLIGKFGLDEADRVVPSYQVQSLEQSAQQELVQAQAEDDAANSGNSLPDFAAPQELSMADKARLAALEAENARLLAEAQAHQAAARAVRTQAAHAANVSFAEGLVSAGRLPTSASAVVVATLDLLADQAEASGKVVEFGEGNTKAPLATALQDLLKSLPVQVQFAEFATAERAMAGEALTTTLDFAVPPGAKVEASSMALHRKVKAYMAAHPNTSYLDALSAVQGAA